MGNSNWTNGGSDTREDHTHVPVVGSSTRDHYPPGYYDGKSANPAFDAFIKAKKQSEKDKE